MNQYNCKYSVLVDTERKLNVHKTFSRRLYVRSIYVLCLRGYVNNNRQLDLIVFYILPDLRSTKGFNLTQKLF